MRGSDFSTPKNAARLRRPRQGRGARRSPGAPPFRRRSRPGPPETGGRGSGSRHADARPLLTGLSAGGTLDDLSGVSVRRRAAVAGASAGFHLLLLLLFLGGLIPAAPSEPAAAPTEDPLLYAFEAPPLEEPQPVDAALEPPPPALLPEETAPEAAQAQPPPPAAGIVIPEAQIAVPNTGFQNDLPFSEGEDEEFYVDHEMGEELSAEADRSEAMDGAEPEFVTEIPAIEEAAEAPAEPALKPPGVRAVGGAAPVRRRGIPSSDQRPGCRRAAAR